MNRTICEGCWNAGADSPTLADDSMLSTVIKLIDLVKPRPRNKHFWNLFLNGKSTLNVEEEEEEDGQKRFVVYFPTNKVKYRSKIFFWPFVWVLSKDVAKREKLCLHCSQNNYQRSVQARSQPAEFILPLSWINMRFWHKTAAILINFDGGRRRGKTRK